MTGRPDYDAGDLVECFCAAPPEMHLKQREPGMIGRVFQVGRIVPPESDRDFWTVQLAGRLFTAYPAVCFRKVRSLPESLTRLLATDAPVRIREDA